MMAQPALQQGKLLGENIVKLIQNKAMEPFEYNDMGSMATIGRNKAVVDLPNYHFSGVLLICLDVCSFILANRIKIKPVS
jgi:NADH dehydrogenase